MSSNWLKVTVVLVLIGGAIVAKTWSSQSQSSNWYSKRKEDANINDDANNNDGKHFTAQRHGGDASAHQQMPPPLQRKQQQQQQAVQDLPQLPPPTLHPEALKWNNYPEFQLPFDISQCTHVYLDLGTNRGFQLEKLFLGSKPNSPWAQKFGQYFGPRSEWVTKVCAIGAEPDRTHTGHLNDLEKRITDTGARLKILRNPIWVNNDEMTFHSVWQPEHHNWGSTLSTMGYAHLPNVTKYILRGYRLSSLLAQLRPDAVVVAKLDIEGAEHRVITDIVLDGTICRFNFAGIEFHRSFMTDDHHALSSGAALQKFLSVSGRCKNTVIEEFDDES